MMMGSGVGSCKAHPPPVEVEEQRLKSSKSFTPFADVTEKKAG